MEVIIMGIIKAAVHSVGGVLADSWLESIEPNNMSETTVMTMGVNVKNRKSSNTKGTDCHISNGSLIHVYPNTMMLLVDGGKIVDYCATEGYYEVNLSTSPSLFNGELSESIKDTFERFKFGGMASSSQKVYYINLREIKDLRFGTANAVNYYDNKYDAELFLRAHGSYSIKITDPLKFFVNAIPQNSRQCEIDQINEQFLNEFVCALQTSINQMSVDGINISQVASKSMELCKYMSNALDDSWRERMGMEVVSVAIKSISYDENSRKLIDMRNQGAMLKDANIREGYVQGSIAEGLKNAGSNTAGAGQAFMAMGMGMNSAGNFMNSASQTNAQQMQYQQQQQQAQQQAQMQANTWKCSCGATNTGNFCMNCGSPKPQPQGQWTCSCGTVNSGKFCINCGKPKPQPEGQWTCSCGSVNTGNFCMNCGKKRD